MKENILVDYLNSHNPTAFRDIEQETFAGVTGAITLSAGNEDYITIAQPTDRPLFDLSNSVHGTQAYLYIRSIDIGSMISLPAAFAKYAFGYVIYYDFNNQPHYIGLYSTLEYTAHFQKNLLIPVPVLDDKIVNLGKIGIRIIDGVGGANTGTFNFTVSYSSVYLQPDSSVHWIEDIAHKIDDFSCQFKQFMDTLE